MSVRTQVAATSLACAARPCTAASFGRADPATREVPGRRLPAEPDEILALCTLADKMRRSECAVHGTCTHPRISNEVMRECRQNLPRPQQDHRGSHSKCRACWHPLGSGTRTAGNSEPGFLVRTQLRFLTLTGTMEGSPRAHLETI